ncbi:outer membrane protein [Bradyrhizobium japonicum]|uniref:outer membrane protein n=1 Tax=Bradyrhizobium japonicum TaxID=375 RepID=UPI001F0A18DB|nr:outer membrane beta-barrel protein [Bradyrhizobium japonicum]
MKSSFVSAALFAICVSVAARAADMPVKAPPIPSPLYNWNGFYLGANLGGAWTNGSLNIPGNNLYGGTTEFMAGVQAGYNFQAGHLLLGVEGDFDGATFGRFAIPTPTLGTVQQNWIGTIAGRFGLVEDKWLLYAKLGGGWVHSNAMLNFPGVAWQGSNTSSGWLEWVSNTVSNRIGRSNSNTITSGWEVGLRPPPRYFSSTVTSKWSSSVRTTNSNAASPTMSRRQEPGIPPNLPKTKTLPKNRRTRSPTSSAFRSKAIRISTQGRSTALRKCSTFSQSYHCASTRTGT